MSTLSTSADARMQTPSPNHNGAVDADENNLGLGPPNRLVQTRRSAPPQYSFSI